MNKQYGRPSVDTSVVSWAASAGSSLWAMIDESVASDSDYAHSSTDNVMYVTKLTSLTDPKIGTGHIVRWRAGKGTGTDSYYLDVYLLEGSTTRASWTTAGPYPVATTETMTLSAAEANAITDYTNLYLKFVSQFVEGPPI